MQEINNTQYFKVEKEAGFDESLYVPPKPEFELYLDRQDMNTVGAKLMAAYGDDKYNVCLLYTSPSPRD